MLLKPKILKLKRENLGQCFKTIITISSVVQAAQKLFMRKKEFYVNEYWTERLVDYTMSQKMLMVILFVVDEKQRYDLFFGVLLSHLFWSEKLTGSSRKQERDGTTKMPYFSTFKRFYSQHLKENYSNKCLIIAIYS